MVDTPYIPASVKQANADSVAQGAALPQQVQAQGATFTKSTDEAQEVFAASTQNDSGAGSKIISDYLGGQEQERQAEAQSQLENAVETSIHPIYGVHKISDSFSETAPLGAAYHYFPTVTVDIIGTPYYSVVSGSPVDISQKFLADDIYSIGLTWLDEDGITHSGATNRRDGLVIMDPFIMTLMGNYTGGTLTLRPSIINENYTGTDPTWASGETWLHYFSNLQVTTEYNKFINAGFQQSSVISPNLQNSMNLYLNDLSQSGLSLTPDLIASFYAVHPEYSQYNPYAAQQKEQQNWANVWYQPPSSQYQFAPAGKVYDPITGTYIDANSFSQDYLYVPYDTGLMLQARKNYFEFDINTAITSGVLNKSTAYDIFSFKGVDVGDITPYIPETWSQAPKINESLYNILYGEGAGVVWGAGEGEVGSDLGYAYYTELGIKEDAIVTKYAGAFDESYGIITVKDKAGNVIAAYQDMWGSYLGAIAGTSKPFESQMLAPGSAWGIKLFSETGQETSANLLGVSANDIANMVQLSGDSIYKDITVNDGYYYGVMGSGESRKLNLAETGVMPDINAYEEYMASSYKPPEGSGYEKYTVINDIYFGVTTGGDAVKLNVATPGSTPDLKYTGFDIKDWSTIPDEFKANVGGYVEFLGEQKDVDKAKQEYVNSYWNSLSYYNQNDAIKVYDPVSGEFAGTVYGGEVWAPGTFSWQSKVDVSKGSFTQFAAGITTLDSMGLTLNESATKPPLDEYGLIDEAWKPSADALKLAPAGTQYYDPYDAKHPYKTVGVEPTSVSKFVAQNTYDPGWANNPEGYAIWQADLEKQTEIHMNEQVLTDFLYAQTSAAGEKSTVQKNREITDALAGLPTWTSYEHLGVMSDGSGGGIGVIQSGTKVAKMTSTGLAYTTVDELLPSDQKKGASNLFTSVNPIGGKIQSFEEFVMPRAVEKSADAAPAAKTTPMQFMGFDVVIPETKYQIGPGGGASADIGVDFDVLEQKGGAWATLGRTSDIIVSAISGKKTGITDGYTGVYSEGQTTISDLTQQKFNEIGDAIFGKDTITRGAWNYVTDTLVVGPLEYSDSYVIRKERDAALDKAGEIASQPALKSVFDWYKEPENVMRAAKYSKDVESLNALTAGKVDTSTNKWIGTESDYLAFDAAYDKFQTKYGEWKPPAIDDSPAAAAAYKEYQYWEGQANLWDAQAKQYTTEETIGKYRTDEVWGTQFIGDKYKAAQGYAETWDDMWRSGLKSVGSDFDVLEQKGGAWATLGEAAAMTINMPAQALVGIPALAGGVLVLGKLAVDPNRSVVKEFTSVYLPSAIMSTGERAVDNPTLFGYEMALNYVGLEEAVAGVKGVTGLRYVDVDVGTPFLRTSGGAIGDAIGTTKMVVKSGDVNIKAITWTDPITSLKMEFGKTPDITQGGKLFINDIAKSSQPTKVLAYSVSQYVPDAPSLFDKFTLGTTKALPSEYAGLEPGKVVNIPRLETVDSATTYKYTTPADYLKYGFELAPQSVEVPGSKRVIMTASTSTPVSVLGYKLFEIPGLKQYTDVTDVAAKSFPEGKVPGRVVESAGKLIEVPQFKNEFFIAPAKTAIKADIPKTFVSSGAAIQDYDPFGMTFGETKAVDAFTVTDKQPVTRMTGIGLGDAEAFRSIVMKEGYLPGREGIVTVPATISLLKKEGTGKIPEARLPKTPSEFSFQVSESTAMTLSDVYGDVQKGKITSANMFERQLIAIEAAIKNTPSKPAHVYSPSEIIQSRPEMKEMVRTGYADYIDKIADAMVEKAKGVDNTKIEKNIQEIQKQYPGSVGKYSPEVVTAVSKVYDLANLEGARGMEGIYHEWLPERRVVADAIVSGKLDAIPEIARLSPTEKGIVAATIKESAFPGTRYDLSVALKLAEDMAGGKDISFTGTTVKNEFGVEFVPRKEYFSAKDTIAVTPMKYVEPREMTLGDVILTTLKEDPRFEGVRVGGSFGQAVQMDLARPWGDIDLYVKDVNSAKFALMENVYIHADVMQKHGWSLDPKSENYIGGLFDVHEGAPTGSDIGRFGIKTEKDISVEGLQFMPVREQFLRKATMIAEVRETPEGTFYTGVEPHRGKDLADYFGIGRSIQHDIMSSPVYQTLITPVKKVGDPFVDTATTLPSAFADMYYGKKLRGLDEGKLAVMQMMQPEYMPVEIAGGEIRDPLASAVKRLETFDWQVHDKQFMNIPFTRKWVEKTPFTFETVTKPFNEWGDSAATYTKSTFASAKGAAKGVWDTGVTAWKRGEDAFANVGQRMGLDERAMLGSGDDLYKTWKNLAERSPLKDVAVENQYYPSIRKVGSIEDSVAYYASISGSDTINTFMRKGESAVIGKQLVETADVPYIQQHIDNIYSAFIPATREITTYRGVGGSTASNLLRQIEDISDFKIGKITDTGFMSTSLRPDVAEGFAKIIVKKPQDVIRQLFIEHTIQQGDAILPRTIGLNARGEHELLLPPGELRVDSVVPSQRTAVGNAFDAFEPLPFAQVDKTFSIDYVIKTKRESTFGIDKIKDLWKKGEEKFTGIGEKLGLDESGMLFPKKSEKLVTDNIGEGLLGERIGDINFVNYLPDVSTKVLRESVGKESTFYHATTSNEGIIKQLETRGKVTVESAKDMGLYFGPPETVVMPYLFDDVAWTPIKQNTPGGLIRIRSAPTELSPGNIMRPGELVLPEKLPRIMNRTEMFQYVLPKGSELQFVGKSTIDYHGMNISVIDASVVPSSVTTVASKGGVVDSLKSVWKKSEEKFVGLGEKFGLSDEGLLFPIKRKPEPEVTPTVYLKPENIESYTGWGGEKQYTVKGEGVLVKGVIEDISKVPDTLYHVTTNLPAVVDSGMLKHMGRGTAGLGKGSGVTHAGVSFTTSLDDATLIKTEIGRVVEISRGAEFPQKLPEYIEADIEILRTRGASPEAISKLKNVLPGMFEEYDFRVKENQQYYEEGKPKATQTAGVDVLRQYRVTRESITGGILQDPIIFGGPEQFAKIVPENIGIVYAKKTAIPKEAVIRDPIEGFMHEIMVHSNVPIEGIYTDRPTVNWNVEKTGYGEFDRVIRDQGTPEGSDLEYVGKLKWMSPEEFIGIQKDILETRAATIKSERLTGQEMFNRGISEGNINALVGDMLSGKEFKALAVEYDLTGKLKDFQEGRHRAVAAKEIGVEKLPVWEFKEIISEDQLRRQSRNMQVMKEIFPTKTVDTGYPVVKKIESGYPVVKKIESGYPVVKKIESGYPVVKSSAIKPLAYSSKPTSIYGGKPLALSTKAYGGMIAVSKSAAYSMVGLRPSDYGVGIKSIDSGYKSIVNPSESYKGLVPTASYKGLAYPATKYPATTIYPTVIKAVDYGYPAGIDTPYKGLVYPDAIKYPAPKYTPEKYVEPTYQSGKYSEALYNNILYPTSTYPKETKYSTPKYSETTYPVPKYPTPKYPTPNYPSAKYPDVIYPTDYPKSDYPKSDYPKTDYPKYPKTDYPKGDYPSTKYPDTVYPPTIYPPVYPTDTYKPPYPTTYKPPYPTTYKPPYPPDYPPPTYPPLFPPPPPVKKKKKADEDKFEWRKFKKQSFFLFSELTPTWTARQMVTMFPNRLANTQYRMKSLKMSGITTPKLAMPTLSKPEKSRQKKRNRAFNKMVGF